MRFNKARRLISINIFNFRFAKIGSSLPWLSTDCSCTSSSSSPLSAPSASSWTRRTSSSTSTRTRSSTSIAESRVRKSKNFVAVKRRWRKKKPVLFFQLLSFFFSSLSFLLSISNSTKCQNNRRTINKEFHSFSLSYQEERIARRKKMKSSRNREKCLFVENRKINCSSTKHKFFVPDGSAFAVTNRIAKRDYTIPRPKSVVYFSASKMLVGFEALHGSRVFIT